MYYGARYYDPALARFITADTVYDAGPQGLNRYFVPFRGYPAPETCPKIPGLKPRSTIRCPLGAEYASLPQGGISSQHGVSTL